MIFALFISVFYILSKRMEYNKLSKKDFNWINWDIESIKKQENNILNLVNKTIKDIKAVEDKKRNFENTFYPLEKMAFQTDSLKGKLSILINANQNKEIRDFAEKTEIKIVNFLIKVMRDKKFYESLKKYDLTKEKLLDEEKLFIKDLLKTFKKMGLDLPKEKQNILTKLQKENVKLSSEFAKNIRDYKDHINVNKEDLTELSETYINNLEKNKDGTYKIGLDYPELGPFIKKCPNEKLREELVRKSYRKGGDKNLKILKKLAENKLQIAKILGYKTYAQLVVEDRMAKTPENIHKFLDDLKNKLEKKAKLDFQIMEKRKQKDFKEKVTLKSWDISYYIGKLMKENFDLDSEKLREYFPMDHVLKTMFEHFEHLFDIKFKKTNSISKWHKDVIWIEVLENNKVIGYISMDLYPRDGKYKHMAMFPIVPAGEDDFRSNKYNPPVSAILCNFAKPSGKTPSLITLGEAETLFHEFGHLLHGTLTKAKLSSQAGTNTAWDFVETPSQFAEMWFREKEFLNKIGKHYKTGEKIPKKTIEMLLNTENFLGSYFSMGNIMFSKYDLELHDTNKIPSDINSIFNKMNKEYKNIEMPKDAMFPAGFGHLSESYSAGYYSYLWSLVYAFDIFSEFKKHGIFNKKIGLKYKKEILEVGSSRDEMESLEKFLGRKPNNKAYLESLGVK